jgi:hypothetical protein
MVLRLGFQGYKSALAMVEGFHCKLNGGWCWWKNQTLWYGDGSCKMM